jgi:hypothetical protein
MKLKVTIIDDDFENRKNAYERVFNEDNFEIQKRISKYAEFVEAFGKLEEASGKKKIDIVDAYIVDLFLDMGDWKKAKVDMAVLLEKLTNITPLHTTPVILVSQNWKKTGGILQMLSHLRKASVHIVDYLSLKELKDTEKNSLQARLATKIRDYSPRSAFSPKPDDPVRILLLSDMQFKDPDIDERAELAATEIAKQLKKDKRLPDLFLLAGDISYSGHPDEFAVAENWLKNRLLTKFPNPNVLDDRDRIILAPGNHDVNLRFSAANAWDYKPPSKNRKQAQWEKAEEVGKGCQDYALEAFRRFAYNMTGQREWKDPAHPTVWIDNRFLESGLRFFIFNTVYGLDINNLGFSTFDLPAVDSAPPEFYNDEHKAFNMTLSHHGECPQGVRAESANNWPAFRNFCKIFDIKACIYGHYHKSAVAQLDGSPWTIALPTLFVKTEDTTYRGISLLEVQRKNGEVTEMRVFRYFFENGENGELKPTETGHEISIYKADSD